MSNIALLPTAAAVPVVNAPRRGRLPANVVRLRTAVPPDDLVRITNGANAGKLCRVVGIRYGGALDIAPISGTLLGVEGSLLKEARIERGRVCRVAERKSVRQQYSLPAWPKRWEAALAAKVGDQV